MNFIGNTHRKLNTDKTNRRNGLIEEFPTEIRGRGMDSHIEAHVSELFLISTEILQWAVQMIGWCLDFHN